MKEIFIPKVGFDFEKSPSVLKRFFAFIFWPIFLYKKIREGYFGDEVTDKIFLGLIVPGSFILVGIVIASIVGDFIFAIYLGVAYCFFNSIVK